MHSLKLFEACQRRISLSSKNDVQISLIEKDIVINKSWIFNLGRTVRFWNGMTFIRNANRQNIVKPNN